MLEEMLKLKFKVNIILYQNVYLTRNIMELSSNNITKIYDDNFNFYQLDNFKYLKKEGLLKGNNVKITTNINNTELSDVFTFDDGFFNLKQNNFKASKTKVLMHKNLFGNQENDPRLNGVSLLRKTK